MTLFQRGDPVTLTPRFAEALARRTYNRRTDWKSRRGIVRICNDHTVGVVWEGRSSMDMLPVKAVTRAA